MSEKEKSEYVLNLKKFAEEDFPRLCAVQDAWSEADYKSFNTGLQLISAYRNLHDFISVAYRYEAQKRLRKLGELLARVRAKTELRNRTMNPSVLEKEYVAFLPTAKNIDENGESKPKEPFAIPEVSGRRPEHLSQYIHKLSPELQKQAKELESLYMAMASHKEQALLLANDSRATKADIEHEAKATIKAEAKILNFWEQVDLEWEKITGKEIDEEEMERLKAESERLNRQVVKSAGEYTKEEIDAMDDEEMQENCKKARIEANKKYLRRSDVQMTDERREQTALRAQELLAWGIELSARAKETIEQNGIEVPGLSIEENNEDIEL